MQKFINTIALLSGLVSLSVMGGAWYLYKNSDILIEKAREKAVEEITEAIPGIVEGLMPDIPDAPELPTETGLPIQPF